MARGPARRGSAPSPSTGAASPCPWLSGSSVPVPEGGRVSREGSSGVARGGPAGAGPRGRVGSRDEGSRAEQAACGCHGRAARRWLRGHIQASPAQEPALTGADGRGGEGRDLRGSGRRGRGCAGSVEPGLHHRFLLYGDCTYGQSGMAPGRRDGTARHGTRRHHPGACHPQLCPPTETSRHGKTLYLGGSPTLLPPPRLPRCSLTHLAAPLRRGVPGLHGEGVLGSQRGAGAARGRAGSGGAGQDHVVGPFALRGEKWVRGGSGSTPSAWAHSLRGPGEQHGVGGTLPSAPFPARGGDPAQYPIPSACRGPITITPGRRGLSPCASGPSPWAGRRW